MKLKTVLLTGTLLAVCATATAAPTTIAAYRISKPPVIDGVINDDEWKGVPTVTGMVDSNTNQKASDGATFWLAYDADFIYIAARFADSSPKDIRASQYQTNVNLQGDDYVQIDLDTTGSATDFNAFQVNPRSATNILLAGGRAAKREWAGEFQGASQITATGWETEMRIPWRVMQLPGQGAHNLRINFERFIARQNRNYVYAFTSSGSANDVPIWSAVELPETRLDRSIKLLPYMYGGYDPNIHGVFNAGLDLKTPLTDQIQLVGSINPDFRNIENQILNLDYSRFARLPGESRSFFLEGSQYIGSALFSSQLIPRFDVGTNAYGKLSDKVSFGVLDTVGFSKANDLVANGTYSPTAATSYRFGATSHDEGSLHNEAYLARYSGNWGPWGVFARDMGSQDTVSGHGENVNGAFFYQAAGWNTFAEYSWVSPQFNPRLGFFPEVDYRGYDGNLSYNKPWNTGRWNDAGTSFSFLEYQHANGASYRNDYSGNVFGTLRGGLYGVLGLDVQNFEGSHDHLLTAQVGFPRGNPYDSVTGTYVTGEEEGSAFNSYTLEANRLLGRRLQLVGRYQAVSFQGFNDQAVIGANFDLKHDQTVYGRLVKQGSNLNAYLAYRRSGNLGSEYYVILGDPNAQTFRSSLIFKLVVPLEILRR